MDKTDNAWLTDDDNWLIENYSKYPVLYLATKLNSSPYLISKRLKELDCLPKEQLQQAPERSNINQIIKPFRNRGEFHIMGEKAESVILSLI